MNIIKVKFLKAGQPSGRAYTYFSKDVIAVDDIVQINSHSRGIVTAVDIPEEEIADYKDKVKFIHGKVKEIETEPEENKEETECQIKTQ